MICELRMYVHNIIFVRVWVEGVVNCSALDPATCFLFKMSGKPRTFLREYKSVSCHFIAEPPANLLCGICFSILNDPQQATCCGNVFCRGCIKNVTDKNTSCPCCKLAIQTFRDKRTEQDVGNLRVVCPNDWCSNQVELRELEEHRAGCTDPYSLRGCEFSGMGCPRKGTRIEIEQHAKEAIVQHLALCRRKIGELEAALHGQVQGGGEIPGVDEEVIVMKPKVYTVIIPIDQYDEYKKSRCVWERAEFKVGEWTLSLRLTFDSSSSTKHIVALGVCDGKSLESLLYLNVTANIGVFNDFACNSLILKTPLFCRNIYSKPGNFANVTEFDIANSKLQVQNCMCLKLQIFQITPIIKQKY